jgi:serine-type D-Ala-D-Ala carboxypeptidase/endopeptidase
VKLLAAGLLALAAIAAQAPAEIVASIFTSVTGTPQRPSAAVASIVDGAVRTQLFGTTTVPTVPTVPTTETVYEIGSITKGLTGILLADMALAGEVSLHDTLEAFLPQPERFPDTIRRITLLQLATHMSGLPRLPANLAFAVKDPSNPYAHYGVAELETFLRGYVPPPDRTAITAEYSNLGFGLLGHVLSLKAGMPYEALLKERVLVPLGMRDTSIALSADQLKRLAPGHARGAAVNNWDLPALAGAGAVRSTLADMTRLLQALMHPPDARIGKAIRLALEPRAEMGASKVGLAWIMTVPPGGVPFTWHNGGTGGYRSFIGFTQDRKAGLVVLTNGADQSPDPLAIQALQRLAASR